MWDSKKKKEKKKMELCVYIQKYRERNRIKKIQPKINIIFAQTSLLLALPCPCSAFIPTDMPNIMIMVVNMSIANFTPKGN